MTLASASMLLQGAQPARRRSLLVEPAGWQQQQQLGGDTASWEPACAIYHELAGNHDDVMAGLAFAFQLAGCRVDVFQKEDRYNIQARSLRVCRTAAYSGRVRSACAAYAVGGGNTSAAL